MALHVKVYTPGGILYDLNFSGDGASNQFPSVPSPNLMMANNVQVYLEGTLLTQGSASDEYQFTPGTGFIKFNFIPTADTRIRVIGLTT